MDTRKIPVRIIREETNVPVFSEDGEELRRILLPKIFGSYVRKDLVLRAYLSEFTASLQPKGRDPYAGKRTTAESWGVGRGIARVPRLKNSPRAALINFAVGGRLAHPPRIEKKIHEHINKKERILATISAIAATSYINLAKERGHVFSVETLPVVISDDVAKNVVKTRQAVSLLEKLKILEDVERARRLTRIRAGKGKMRGRRYKEPRSILFVLPDKGASLYYAVKNLPGVDVTTPYEVNVLHLAPGGVPGRLTVYTEDSIKILGDRFENRVSFIY